MGLAVTAFLASHRLTNQARFRAWAETRLGGRLGFTIAYSALSLALLAWIILAYRQAPVVLLWEQSPWMRWVPPIAMVPACLLLAIGMSTANPFSIGPGARGFDPACPGVLRLTRHPVLWAAALWAAAHMAPNGDVAALMIFAPMLALALIGPRLLDAKRRRTLAGWPELARLTGKIHPRLISEIGWWRPLAGLALYAFLLWAHPIVIGASPLP